jgi:hypothetical protein
MSRDNTDPAQRVTFIALITACAVITVLTAAAFWLSYAHLAEVAREHGLGRSPARQWAWPATLDLFIVAGEVLMFVDALRGRKGREAAGPIFLTVAGSLGSIGLNVAGVGMHAPVLDYVVAAVPPTAALLAFGALMRQVHHFIVSLSPAQAVPGDTGQSDVPGTVSPSPVVPGDTSPVKQAAVSPAPRDTVPPVVSPSPAVPEPVPAVVSRTRAAVPAVSPSRPSVHIRLDKTPEEIKVDGDKEAGSVPAVSPARDAKVDVPEDKLGNLSAIVRFLMETGHSKEEIRTIVPTLTGHEDVKPDSLKKAIQRAAKALAEEN